jgi:hypothetical protein
MATFSREVLRRAFKSALHAAVAVMHKTALSYRAAIAQRLPERVEHEVRSGRSVTACGPHPIYRIPACLVCEGWPYTQASPIGAGSSRRPLGKPGGLKMTISARRPHRDTVTSPFEYECRP